ncbi:UTRA domain-containing protein [Streptomyces sp. NPDC091281]|uniref:UTRA domain-containing protein n=1 Tax=Streptomyces sp. NPDC091281 TaxID=3365985 RepID=UPI0037F2A7F2
MADMQRQSDSLAYVKPQQPAHADAWTSETGQRGGQRLTAVAEAPPPLPVAEALRLSPGEPAVTRRRVILLDGDVIELADSYYPTAIARGTALADARKIKGGAPTALAALGHRAHYVAEDLDLRAASQQEAEALSVAAGSTVLSLLRTTVTADGSPIEVQHMVMKAPRRLHYEFEVD